MNQNTNELDDLKSLWKSQSDDKKYDHQAIFNMIHRKSINSVQWLFIITIIEFLIGLLMSLWVLISGKHFYKINQIDLVGQENYLKMENLSHLGIVGSLIILGITYYYYRKISSNLSVQDLISMIIRFRKSVILFIFFWLLFVLIIYMPIMIDVGMNAYLAESSKQHIDTNETIEVAKKVGYITALISMAFIVVFSLLYYGLIYGIFLRRLGKNLKELKEINHA